MAEQVKEEVKRGRPAKVEVVDKVQKALDTPYSAAPRVKAETTKKDVQLVEVLIQTPTGRLDKKVYEVYRSKKKDHKGAGNTYRRLLRIEKGINLKKAIKA